MKGLVLMTDTTSDVARILKIIDFISLNEIFSLDQLIEETGISRRTAHRYLKKLIDAGIEIESSPGRGGGFRVKAHGKLPKMMSNDELIALLFTTGMLKNIDALPFEFQTEQSIRRLRNELPKNKQYLFDRLSEVTELSVSKRVFPVPELLRLQRAAVENHMLRVQYRSASQLCERIITPIGIYLLDGIWYCPAFCRRRQQERLFRVDRIHIVAILDIDSKKHSSLREWRENYDSPDSKEPLIATLTARGIIRAQAIPWIDGQIDGFKLHTYYSSSRQHSIIEDLLSFGPEIIVHHPPEIVAELHQKIAKSYENYQKLYAKQK
ncbi:MAG: helix-turn-helix transcriptional regulator [Culicoidibacterales bacterium]